MLLIYGLHFSEKQVIEVVICILVIAIADKIEQNFLAPLHLHFVVLYLAQAKDYSLD